VVQRDDDEIEGQGQGQVKDESDAVGLEQDKEGRDASESSQSQLGQRHNGQSQLGQKQKAHKQKGPKPQAQPLVLEKSKQDKDATEEPFVGASLTNSSLGNSTSQEIEGEDLQNQQDWAADLPDIASTGSCTDRRSSAGDKDLDNLAMAILPLIKRMLAVERDRRNPHPLM